MDFQLEDKQDAEINKLNYYRQICKDALDALSANHPYQLTEYEKEKVGALLDRLFEGELEYLFKEPENYFELYEED